MKLRTALAGLLGILIAGCDNAASSEAGDPASTDSTARVVFSPASGEIDSVLVVSLSSASTGATIRYTLDGTLPGEGSAVYSAPLTLRAATTVQAFATAPGLARSAVTKAVFPANARRQLLGAWKGTFGGASGTATLLFYPDSQFVLLENPATPGTKPSYRSFGTWEAFDSTVHLRRLRTDSSPDAKRWITLAPVDIGGSATFHCTGDSLDLFGGTLLRLKTPLDSLYRPDSAAAPTIAPDTGSSFSPITVAIVPANAGAEIHYTLDGSTPTKSSPLYSAPFAVSTSCTVKAVAFLIGSLPSRMATSSYRIAPSLVGTWTNSDKDTPMSYTFGSDGTLSLLFKDYGEHRFVRAFGTWRLIDGGFSYVLTSADSSTDETTWGKYLTEPQSGASNSLRFSGDTVFFDTDVPYLKTTSVPGAAIVAAPVASLPEGTYVGMRTVSLSCATPGAVIRYTLDNTDVTDSSPVYKEPLVLRSPVVVTAVAMKTGMVPSAEIALDYAINAGGAELSTLYDARDGKTYPVVTVGTQKWMASNLDHAVDSSWCPEGTDASCARLGRFYNLNAALAGASKVSSSAPKGVKGICPDGSHLPSLAEWGTLVDRFGGWDSAGLALKAASGNGSDASGMALLMAGGIYEGAVQDLGTGALFWTASGHSLEFLSTNRRVTQYLDDDPSFAYTVRCLLD